MHHFVLRDGKVCPEAPSIQKEPIYLSTDSTVGHSQTNPPRINLHLFARPRKKSETRAGVKVHRI